MVNHIKISPLCLSPGTLHTLHPAQAVPWIAWTSRSWSKASFQSQLFVPSCLYLQASLSYSWRPLAVPSGIRSGWNISVGWDGASSYATLAPASRGIKRYPALIWFDNRYIMLILLHSASTTSCQLQLLSRSQLQLVTHSCWSVCFAHLSAWFSPFLHFYQFLAPYKMLNQKKSSNNEILKL